LKLLLDTCVWGGALVFLRDSGHDVIWSGDWPADPGDEEILAFAYKNDRILVTLDKDFGELAVRFGFPHSGIIRLVGISARNQGKICHNILNIYKKDLMKSALITVTSDRVRIRVFSDN